MSPDQKHLVDQRLPAPLVRAWSVVTSDDLLHHGGIVAAATVLSGGLNYAYQLFMGRALGPEQFGAFGALFALFYLLNVLGRGIRFSVSRFVSRFDGPSIASAFHRGALVRSLLIGTAMFAALTAFRGPVGSFLGVDPRLIVVVGATMPPSLALTANAGALEGRQRFLAFGSYKILKAGTKLVLGVVLVLAGFGLYGAFGAIVAALVVALCVTTIYLVRHLGTPDVSTSVGYSEAYRYGVPALLAGFCLTVPANADVILVRHVFSPADAGLYAAASVLGKILVFLPMGISTALFPKVCADDGRGDAQALFDRALLYAAGIGVTGALIYWIAPTTVITVFFGEAYAAGARLVRWYGLAMLPFVLAVVVLNFQLARDRMGFVYLFAAASVVEIVLIGLFHASMLQVVRIVLLVNAVLFAVGFAAVKLEQ